MMAALTAILGLTASLFVAVTTHKHVEHCHIKYQMFDGHTMCLEQSPAAVPLEITDEWRQKIVDWHNARRSTVSPTATNMMKMRWDPEMEEMSRKWADACDSRIGNVHDIQRFIPGSMFVGQSMSSTTLDFMLAMHYWWVESEQYQYGVDYKVQSEGKCGFSVGHYTQMVWAESYLVGCAATTCNNKESVIVCNYGPAGNMLPFENPYEEGPTCSKCKNCTEDGLCDCGDLNCHGGTINMTSCTCDCTFKADNMMVPDFINEPYCTLNCSGKDMIYCGREPVFKDCKQPWTAKKCPHMCNVCPYAEEGYVPADINVQVKMIEKGHGDKLDGINGTFHIHDGVLDGFNGTLSELNGTLRGINGSLSGFHDKLMIHNGTLNGLNGTLNGLEGTLMVMNATLKGLHGILSEHDGTLSVINGTLSGPNGPFKGFNGTLNGLIGDLTVINGTLSGLNSTHGTTPHHTGAPHHYTTEPIHGTPGADELNHGNHGTNTITTEPYV